MAGFVQSLGLQLVDAGNKPFDAKQLAPSDVIALYFSAHWCPPCRQFTPMLKKFVETLQAAGDDTLKVIFVSRDKSEMDMWKYMHEAHGNWLTLSFAGDGRDKLCQRYGVQGIPGLVVLNQVGQPALALQTAVSQVAGAASVSTQVLTTYMSWRSAAGAAAAPPLRPAQAKCSELPPGCRVQIRGLTGAPQHNGSEGLVRGYDASRQRYTVELGEKKSLALRAANLLQLLGFLLLSTSPGSEEERREATIVDFDDEAGELVVQLDAEGAELLRLQVQEVPRQVVLKQESRVVVQGLQSEAAKQWNEKVGKVVEFDESTGRYLVEVGPETQLKIRPESLRIWPFC